MPRHSQGPYLSEDRNAHGCYEIRWTENGRSKRKSTGASDLRLAQRVYAEFILADQEVKAPAALSVTVAEVIDAYVADKTEVVDGASQLVTFGHLKAHFGTLAVTEIESDDCTEYLEARADGTISFIDAKGKQRGGRTAGPPTVRRELGMLSTAIGYCIRKKRFRDRLRAGDKPDIELPPAPPARDRWLSRDEARAFLACAADYQDTADGRLPRVYRYIAMMLYTAARRETVFSLTWDRIHLDRGLVNFQAPGRKVTKKRRGWVPIGAELLPILQRAERERCSEFFLDRATPPHKAFRTVAKRAGLTVSPHDLRRTIFAAPGPPGRRRTVSRCTRSPASCTTRSPWSRSTTPSTAPPICGAPSTDRSSPSWRKPMTELPEVKWAFPIMDTWTGEVRVYVTESYEAQEEEDERGIRYMWQDGNYSCDCNRHLFFCRAEPDGDGDENDAECGEGRYFVAFGERSTGLRVMLDEPPAKEPDQ